MHRTLLVLAAVAICLAQTATPPAVSPPAISAFYRLGGQAVSPDVGKPASEWTQYKFADLDPPFTFTLDSANTPHLGISAITSLDVQAGVGVLCVQQVNGSVATLQCSIDTAVVAYRVDPPTGPGPCVDPATNMPYGAGAYSSDGSRHYECAQGATGWVWTAGVESTVW